LKYNLNWLKSKIENALDTPEALQYLAMTEAELREIRDSPKNLSLDENKDVVPDLIKEILGESEDH